MTTISNIGLVLEGGGMRGVFTSGVLDYFMDKSIRFSYGIGVSAGACNGVSYVSQQRGRAKFSNIDMLKEYDYIGLKHFWSQRSILDLDLLYNEFTENLLPFDYNSFFASDMRFEMVTTSCLTGEACYLEEKKDKKRLIDIVKASANLPYVCPIAYVDNVPMLDGGIADSIPVVRAMEQGFARNLVVLTRNKGYRKREHNFSIPYIYKEYPLLREALNRRNHVYNEQLRLIDRLETEGKIVVIRPIKPVNVGRMEKDTKKLTDLYNEGYECARKVFEEGVFEKFCLKEPSKEHKVLP